MQTSDLLASKRQEILLCTVIMHYGRHNGQSHGEHIKNICIHTCAVALLRLPYCLCIGRKLDTYISIDGDVLLESITTLDHESQQVLLFYLGSWRVHLSHYSLLISQPDERHVHGSMRKKSYLHLVASEAHDTVLHYRTVAQNHFCEVKEGLLQLSLADGHQ